MHIYIQHTHVFQTHTHTHTSRHSSVRHRKSQQRFRHVCVLMCMCGSFLHLFRTFWNKFMMLAPSTHACVKGMAWWTPKPPTATSMGTMMPPPPTPPAAPIADARKACRTQVHTGWSGTIYFLVVRWEINIDLQEIFQGKDASWQKAPTRAQMRTSFPFIGNNGLWWLNMAYIVVVVVESQYIIFSLEQGTLPCSLWIICPDFLSPQLYVTCSWLCILNATLVRDALPVHRFFMFNFFRQKMRYQQRGLPAPTTEP